MIKSINFNRGILSNYSRIIRDKQLKRQGSLGSFTHSIYDTVDWGGNYDPEVLHSPSSHLGAIHLHDEAETQHLWNGYRVVEFWQLHPSF